MTTFKGAVRSMNAAVNRMEREQQRRNREAARRFREQQKMQAMLDAQTAVENWEHYVATLQSIHKDCSDPINWKRLQNQSKPVEPKYSDANEQAAKKELTNYKPSWIDKLFGWTAKRIRKLQNRVDEATREDKRSYEKAMAVYHDHLKEWEKTQAIADGVLAKEPEYYAKALAYYQPFSDISELGARVSFSLDKEFIDVELHVNSKEVIPDFILSLTSTGKLSKKNMPKSKFQELYQDHVCSALLRVAREVFAILPVSRLRVTALSDLLNTQTGFLEEKPVLSAFIRKENLDRINFTSVDPSDCIKNFIHTMNFKKTMGFEAVEKVPLPVEKTA